MLPVLPENYQILHIAHTRTYTEGQIPDIVTAIPFDKYDMLCLGGDIDVLTSKERSTMEIWDTLFHFSSPATLWSVGNHDISNRIILEEFTGRPTSYFWLKGDLGFMVLDSEVDKNNIFGGQLEMVQDVSDTLSRAKYIFVLTHKLIWMVGNPDLEDQIDQITNGGSGNCRHCLGPNNFYTDVYPELLKLENRGIQVICVAGDLGFKAKEFDYLSQEGIQFLASGIDFRDDDNQALVFNYASTDTIPMTWRFELLKNL